MIVLVDSDVLIDLALDRQPFAEAAGELLDALSLRPGQGFVAWHSLANFFYLVSPRQGKAQSRDFLRDLVRFLDVAPTTRQSLIVASELPMSDFEDAMQVAAALACGAEMIATRNLGHFSRSPVPAAGPAVVLKALLQ